MFGVYFFVYYVGLWEYLCGFFLMVLWENMVDLIIIGCEELGFVKLFCEILLFVVVGDC